MTTVRSLAAVGVTALALACLGACDWKPLPAPVSQPPMPAPVAADGEFSVGTGRVDLTPPPGVSTFGHGPDALVAEGYWTRIYCRVFVVTSATERIALIPCDLAASSIVLQRTVASLLPADKHLPATRIFFSATHTHAGPAHYFDGQGYSGAESTHMPGFDPEMVAFMAGRIRDGILHAIDTERPATIRSWHYEREDPCPSGACGTWGLTWNRSPGAHAADGVGTPANAPAGLCDLEKEIDPSMHVVRFDDRQGAPIGEIVSFAMHPSVLPNTNRLIGADTAGALSRMLERGLRVESSKLASRGASPDPLAAVLNTNEGDMSPAWKLGTKDEALAVAASLADRVHALTKGPATPKAHAPIDARYVEADLVKVRTSRDGARTCETAEVGLSVAYGACDHPTTSTDGVPKGEPPDDGACQAPKVTPAGSLEHTLAGGDKAFPEVVPLGVVRLDDNLIAFVPAELTIEAGRAVDDAVQSAFGAPAHVWVGGLSNGYILYVTTPKEYAFHGPGGGCYFAPDSVDRQSYEAASTLYGPQTLPRIVWELRKLAGALGKGNGFRGLDAAGGQYVGAPVVSRLPADANGDPNRRALSVCSVDATSVCFRWADAPPGGTASPRAPWVYLGDASGAGIGACEPKSADCDPREIIDDRGTSFVTRVRGQLGTGASERTWATVWRRTVDEEKGLGSASASFYVRDRAGTRPIVSAAFSAAAPPRACTADELSDCGTYDEPLRTPSPLPRDCH